MDKSSVMMYQEFLVAVDCIIVGFDGDEIKVLLVKRGFEPELGKWSLMGGFISGNENVEEAANRVLYTLTGLSNVYMDQVHTFSKVMRDPVERVISVAYFALINLSDHNSELLRKHDAKWFPLGELPPLIFDHQQMVMKSIDRLREQLSNSSIGFELLPPKFTLRQLRRLYEGIYGTVFDRGNFSKRILSRGILNRLNEKEKDSCRKGEFLYTVVDTSKYQRTGTVL